jgi:selenocysteine-specific translation elongation factor
MEHLELLDALGLQHGIAVITKVDVVDADRVAEVRGDVVRLLAGTSLPAHRCSPPIDHRPRGSTRSAGRSRRFVTR